MIQTVLRKATNSMVHVNHKLEWKRQVTIMMIITKLIKLSLNNPYKGGVTMKSLRQSPITILTTVFMVISIASIAQAQLPNPGMEIDPERTAIVRDVSPTENDTFEVGFNV